jgi:hypothetical protein
MRLNLVPDMSRPLIGGAHHTILRVRATLWWNMDLGGIVVRAAERGVCFSGHPLAYTAV